MLYEWGFRCSAKESNPEGLFREELAKLGSRIGEIATKELKEKDGEFFWVMTAMEVEDAEA